MKVVSSLGAWVLLGVCVAAAGAPVRPGEETDPSADIRAAARAAQKSGEYESPAHLRFPYVSTYYVKPVVRSGETVKVGYFTTDWDSSKVRFLDDRFRFDVYLEYAPEGGAWKTLTAKNVRSGDGEIVLGKLPVGDYTFRIWSVDRSNKLESHRVIHEFKVVPPDYFDTRSATYAMTEADLAKYGIDNRGETDGPVPVTDPRWAALEATGEKNADGLQRLIDEKAAAGVRKIVLLKGTYRISGKRHVSMVDGLTLDLNGATLKANAFTGAHGEIVLFPSVRNAHLVNGTLEGDYHDHDYANSPNNSEWPMGFSIVGDTRYSSVRNVVVKDITGYGGSNGIDGEPTTFYPQGLDKRNWQPGSLDEKGLVKPDPYRFTSDFQAFRTRAKDAKYLQLSKYLGYQGRATRSWWMTVCWYDADRRLVFRETAFQYRPMLVPKDAQFLRVSVETATREDAEASGLTMCNFRTPWNCAVIKCKFDNCRAVGYAAAQMRNHLFLGNEFTRSGQKLAKCAFDAEDGWDQMQDVFFFENWFHDNPVNNSILTCAGQNFVMERNRCDIYLWGRTYSPCVRDNDIRNMTAHCDSRWRSGYGRFENNRYEKGVTLGHHQSGKGWDHVLSGVTFGSREKPFDLLVGETGRLVGCTLRGEGIRVGNLYDCTVEDCTMYHLPNGRWTKVRVKDSTLRYVFGTNTFSRCSFEKTQVKGLNGGLKAFEDCTFKDCGFDGVAETATGFRRCAFAGTSLKSEYWEKPARLSFVDSKISVSETNAFLRMCVYSIKSIGFRDCKIAGGEKPLIDIYDMRPQPTDDLPAEIAVRKCTIGPKYACPVLVSVSDGRVDGRSPKTVKFTKPGTKMPRGVAFVADKNILPTWHVDK